MNKCSGIFLAFAAVMIFFAVTVNAEDAKDWNDIYISYESNLKSGGTNKFCDVVCDTEADTYALEEFLNTNDRYLLVNTDDKTISEEEFRLLHDNSDIFPYYTYLEDDYKFNWDNYKVYVYKPLYDDIMSDLKNNNNINGLTKACFASSTVVVNYGQWYYRNRSETVVQEFNDNIPENYTVTGFVRFESPIDCKITLKNAYEGTYNVFYVKGGSPMLVKLPTSTYWVSDISYTNMPDKEETLGAYKNNTFRLNEEFDENNPKVISIGAAVEKYNIQPIDITEEPDFSWENREHITEDDLEKDRTSHTPVAETDFAVSEEPESSQEEDDKKEPIPESVVVRETEKEKSRSMWKAVFAGTAIIILIGVLAALGIYKKKNR